MTKPFVPQQIQEFRFIGYEFDEASTTAHLRYAFDDSHHFVETLTFPALPVPLTPSQRLALDHCLRLLHLVAGISYYKAAIPPMITVSTGLDEATARFVETLYRQGLGEFAWRNGLTLHHAIDFPVDGQANAPEAITLPLTDRILVPVGGGKDSIVSIEALKKAGEQVTLFSVGTAKPIADTVKKAALPWLHVRRQLSPELFKLNEAGAYNGHIPVTAIVSLIAACCAILHGHNAIALSNERSASFGNMQLEDGFVVNHQYSKSLEFERALSHYVHHHIVSNLDYFSLLRPFSELHIARQFSRSTQYHDVFTSCNSNFKIQASGQSKRWCLDCPKCRFVFLALAPFMEKEKLIGIFGGNLLDDPRQEAGYLALLGIDDHKPFECVGEEAECAAAFVLLSQQEAWANDTLVKRFITEVLPGIENPDELVAEYLTPSPDHQIPERFNEMIHADFQS